jgi:hypothetical protein
LTDPPCAPQIQSEAAERQQAGRQERDARSARGRDDGDEGRHEPIYDLGNDLDADGGAVGGDRSRLNAGGLGATTAVNARGGHDLWEQQRRGEGPIVQGGCGRRLLRLCGVGAARESADGLRISEFGGGKDLA